MTTSPRFSAGRIRSLIDELRGSYWFLPMTMVVGAAVCAVLSIMVDRVFGEAIVERVPWIANTEADGTRAVLSVIAGSMITVTGVVFSITVVALTLASSQFGPRLLRNFLRDRSNQLAFGAFVATFLFSLLVLRSVREDAVPHLSSAIAVLLAVVSLFVLIYFIHNTASAIQASNVIASVAAEIDSHVGSLFPDKLGESPPRAAGRADPDRFRARLRKDGRTVTPERDGFIRVVDQETLLKLATDNDLEIELRHRPGDFVLRRETLAVVGPAARASDDVVNALRDAIVVGDLRSAVQDLGFLIGQLVETAVRALSPGDNDPRTAIDCVRRLGALVCVIGDRRMPSGERYDDDGRLRAVVPAPTFESIAGSCFDPIRRYGASHTAVAVSMIEVIGAAGSCCEDASRRAVLAGHVAEVRAAFMRAGDTSGRDRDAVEAASIRARSHLDG